MLRPDKSTYLSLLFRLIFLSVRLINSLWGSDVLLFSEFINIVSNLFYNFIEFIILLYTFLVISFFQYREYTFTCARARSICLGVNILRPSPYFALYLASDTILEYSTNNLITFSHDLFNFFLFFFFSVFWFFPPFNISFISDWNSFCFSSAFLVLYNPLLYFYKNQVGLYNLRKFWRTFTLKIIS